MYKIIFLVSFIMALPPANAARIEVGDNINRIETSQSASGLSLRSQKRLGLGLSVLGPAGFAGTNLEINFSPRWSIIGGLGASEDFNSYYIEYKRVLAGESFIPYASLGLTSWQGEVNGPITSTSPSFLYKDLMSSKDKREGNINEFLIYPAAGIQYVQLGGEWQGFSLYAQINVFFDIVDFALAPQLGIGTTYYF